MDLGLVRIIVRWLVVFVSEGKGGSRMCFGEDGLNLRDVIEMFIWDFGMGEMDKFWLNWFLVEERKYKFGLMLFFLCL